MTFNPSIPQPGDLLSNSQGDILNNFTSLNTLYGINHFAFSPSTANNGKHKYVDMVAQALPTISAGEVGLYANTAGQTQLFATSDAGGFSYQMSRFIDAQFAQFGAPTNGWTFLPGGLLLQYGTKPSPGLNGSVTYPIPFAIGTVAYSIQCTLERSSAGQSVTVNDSPLPTNTTFFYQVTNSASSTALFWMAIGR